MTDKAMTIKSEDGSTRMDYDASTTVSFDGDTVHLESASAESEVLVESSLSTVKLKIIGYKGKFAVKFKDKGNVSQEFTDGVITFTLTNDKKPRPLKAVNPNSRVFPNKIDMSKYY